MFLEHLAHNLLEPECDKKDPELQISGLCVLILITASDNEGAKMWANIVVSPPVVASYLPHN